MTQHPNVCYFTYWFHPWFVDVSKLLQCYSRPLFAAGDNETVSQGGVHGEDRPGVSFGHHPEQVVIPPHVHVPINGPSERQVVLKHRFKCCSYCKHYDEA